MPPYLWQLWSTYLLGCDSSASPSLELDAVEFALARKAPCTVKQIVTVEHDLIHETGACGACCKDQREFQEINQTWVYFKQFFSKKNRYLHESQVIAIGHQVNLENQDMDQVLDHEISSLKSIANITMDITDHK